MDEVGAILKGGAGGLTHGFDDYDLDHFGQTNHEINSAIFPSVQAELDRQWNHLNQCHATRPVLYNNKVCIKSPCTVSTALLALIEVHGLLIQT